MADEPKASIGPENPETHEGPELANVQIPDALVPSARQSSEPEPLSGTRGEALFKKLLSEIDVMYVFARNAGKQLSEDLEADISRLLVVDSSTAEAAPESPVAKSAPKSPPAGRP